MPEQAIPHSATSSATATQNSDYVGASGWRTILAGNISTSLSVVITEDSLDEVDEYFNVALSSISNANVGDIAAVGTIFDNDAPPSLLIYDVSGNEGTTLGFIASLSSASGRDITFNFATVDTGSATSGTDFTSGSGARTILAGQGLVTIGVVALTDSIFESSETFQVTLSSLVNVTGSDTLAVGTILNTNSAPSLFVSDATVTEGQSAVVNVSLSATSAVPVTFNWTTVNGTALAGTDYTAGSGARTILPGALSSALTIITINDALFEGSLTLGINVSSVVGATVVDGSGSVTILDNETPPISYFTVQGIPDPTTVGTPGSVTVTAFNTLGAVKTDYVGTITFSSNNSNAVLPANYTFVGGDAGVRVFNNAVTFNSIGTYYVRAEQVGAATIFGQQSNIDVTNPSAPCNVSTAGFQVSSSSGNESITSVDLVVALSQSCTTAVTLSFNTLNGTATAGSDYQSRSGVLTIPAGTTSRTLNFTVIDDATNEGGGSETFLVSLSNVGPANVSLGTAVHTYTIFDNEGTPPCPASTIGFVNSSVSGLESVTSPVFTVSLSQTCTQNVTVNYAFANLSATNGSDFTGVNGTATVLAGQLTTSIPVTVINDLAAETPESFRVNLFNAAPNAVAVGLSARDYTINDNDGGPPPCSTTIGFAQQNGSALESVTGVNLVINSSVACSGYEITVDYTTADLSATSGSDYTFASGRVTFPVNVTSVTVPISVTNDASAEGEEAFKVEISNPQPAGAIILGNAVYTHTILDNDSGGTIYYVRTPAKGGNDANNGLSPSTAFATLGRAITAVTAGATVFVGAGNYAESLTIQTAGSVGSPIRWIGDVTGSNTGDPGGVTLSDSGANVVINVNNKGYNTFTNFVIRGATGGDGISSTNGAPAGIIFKNNTIRDNQTGVTLRGAGAMTFENNIVSNNSSVGVLLDNNTRDTIFRNNLVINNGGVGLQLAKNNTGVIIINNTFDSNTGNQIQVGQNGTATITNNIMTNGSAGGIARVSSGAATINFNNVWNNSSGNYTGGFAAGANDISSNPLFVGGGSYRVQTTSPTLDSGSANASTITFSDGSSMADRSTRSDGVNDGNTFGGDGLKVNMGYHY